MWDWGDDAELSPFGGGEVFGGMHGLGILGVSCADASSDPAACEQPASGWGANCTDYQSAAATYQKLAGKSDKSAATRQNAANYAAAFQQKYANCMAAKAVAAAQPVVTVQQDASAQPVVANLMPGSIVNAQGQVVTPWYSNPMTWAAVAGLGAVALTAWVLLKKKKKGR